MTAELTWYKMLAIAAMGGIAGVAVDVAGVIKGDSREMGTLIANVQNLDKRFDGVETRLDRLEDKIDKILPIIYRLEQKLNPPKKRP